MKNTTSENTLSQVNEGNNLDSSKNTELLERIEVEDTPFKIVGNEEIGYFGTMGKYRVTEETHDKEGLKNWLQKPNNWELFGNFVTVIVQETLKAQAEEAMKELTEGINNESAE